jgi:hypothetical protein
MPILQKRKEIVHVAQQELIEPSMTNCIVLSLTATEVRKQKWLQACLLKMSASSASATSAAKPKVPYPVILQPYSTADSSDRVLILSASAITSDAVALDGKIMSPTLRTRFANIKVRLPPTQGSRNSSKKMSRLNDSCTPLVWVATFLKPTVTPPKLLQTS